MPSVKHKLKISISALTQIFIKKIMAFSTKCEPIIYIKPQFWVLIPGFYVMYDDIKFSFELLKTILASRIITSNTFISPINIKMVAKTCLKYTLFHKFHSRFFKFSPALNKPIRFICTARRAKSFFTYQIRVFIEKTITTLTSLISTAEFPLFTHQYEYIGKGY